MTEVMNITNMPKKEIIKLFKEELIDFVEQIKSHFCDVTKGEEKDFDFVLMGIKLANEDFLICDFFKKIQPYSQKIMRKDKNYFINDARQIFKELPEEKIIYYCNKIKNEKDEEVISTIFDYLNNFLEMCKCYSNK